MCLAIYKPAGKAIRHKYLRSGFLSNPDGAGIAWSDGSTLHVSKGFFKADDLIDEYRKHESCPMLIHFRFATHGAVNDNNCHPFAFGNGQYAAIHNGILPIKTEPGQSDTHTFVRLVLEPMMKRVPLADPVLKYLIEQTIGSANKIAVMDNTGTTVLFNEQSGHWHKGCWYSNSDYKGGEGWWRHYRDGEDFGSCVMGTDCAEDASYEVDCPNCGTDLSDLKPHLGDRCPYCGDPLYSMDYASGLTYLDRDEYRVNDKGITWTNKR